MPETRNPTSGFRGMRVLTLESRRAREMAQLIVNHGGQPVVAPAMREVTVKDTGDVREFASALLAGQFAAVIFLTGVGTRALVEAAEQVCSRPELVAALKRTAVIARGPKPTAALRELGVPIAATVPEPNTWRELLTLLDEKRDSIPLAGRRVALQEYGVPSPELLAGLRDRGAVVLPIKTYEWGLPEDPAPLYAAVRALIGGQIPIALVTSAAQVRNLLQIAQHINLRDEVIRAFSPVLVGSIGPVASAQLQSEGIHVDWEPTHPKMGWLVKEVADRCFELLESKKAGRKPNYDTRS